MIYLDNAATTPVFPSAAAAAMDAMTENYGNPSSIHKAGQAAKKVLYDARKILAPLARGFSAENIILTSGGTEANNLAIAGVLKGKIRQGGSVFLSATEHASVTEAVKEFSKYFNIVFFEPDRGGHITAKEIESKLTKDAVFVSLMLVNNETGAINDVRAIKPALKRLGADAIVHSDCVAAFGKVALPSTADVDLISVSGHKINAMKGIGALYVKSGVKLKPIIFGGGQQNAMRSGTENVPAAASLAAAAKELFADFDGVKARYEALYDKARKLLESLDFVRINTSEPSSKAVLNVSVPGIPSEVIVRFLQDKDIFVSPASACSSNKGGGSAVLAAMRLPDELRKSAVRISFGRQNAESDVDALYAAIKEAAKHFKICEATK